MCTDAQMEKVSMSEERNKVLDFIIAREGEVEGLQSLSTVVVDRTNSHGQNSLAVQRESSTAINSLERVSASIDVILINLNFQNSENVIGDAFSAIASIRKTVQNEIAAMYRAVGVTEGKVQAFQEAQSILRDRTSSAETTVRNQRVMLTQLVEGDTPGVRSVGEKPMSLKEKRQFQTLIEGDDGHTGEEKNDKISGDDSADSTS